MKQIEVELQAVMGNDEAIANAAWTSTYDADRREEKCDDKEKVAKLVERLANDKHGTPFESVVFRFWIRMPIFTDRQHMTHRMASHNGLSGRYRTMPNEFFELPEDVEVILKKVKYDNEDLHPLHLEDSYSDICRRAFDNYNMQIEHLKEAEKEGRISNAEYKRTREILRGMLPQSGMTERTTMMNLRSFCNYQKQRNSDHAQPEIRRVAELMLEAVERANVCPVAIKALKANGWNI